MECAANCSVENISKLEYQDKSLLKLLIIEQLVLMPRPSLLIAPYSRLICKIRRLTVVGNASC